MKAAIISDIHEDVESLKKVITIAEKKGCDAIYCLGDICGYDSEYYFYPETKNADECITIIRENCDVTVGGNHDYFVAQKLPKFLIDMDIPKNWYSLSIEQQIKIAGSRVFLYKGETECSLYKENLDFLYNLPEYAIIQIGDFTCYISHFVFPNLVGAAKKQKNVSIDFPLHLSEIKNKGAFIGFIGHIHLNGCTIFRNNKLRFSSFGDRRLKNKEQIICCPGVARGTNLSGFIIFDSVNFDLEIIDLMSII